MPRGSARGSPSSPNSGSLVEYLKTFDLTTAVMQTRAGLQPRRPRVRAGPRRRRRRSTARSAGRPSSTSPAGSASTRPSRPCRRASSRASTTCCTRGRASAPASSSRRCGTPIAGSRSPSSPCGTATAASSASTSPAPRPGSCRAGTAPRSTSSRVAVLPGHRARRRGRRPRVDPQRARSTDARSASATACASPKTSSIERQDDENTYVSLGPIAQWVRDREIALETSPVVEPADRRDRGVGRRARRPPVRPALPARLPRHGQHRQPAPERHVAHARARAPQRRVRLRPRRLRDLPAQRRGVRVPPARRPRRARRAHPGRLRRGLTRRALRGSRATRRAPERTPT